MAYRKELLEANLSVLSRRWPTIGRLIAEAVVSASAGVDDFGPQTTLVWEGLHLASGYDREKEARLQAMLVPEASEQAWVYGFGMGDLPRVLLERPALKRLKLVIMNYGVARFSFQHVDHTDWLADPRVDLVAAEDVGRVQMPFAAVPPCLQLAEERAARLRDLACLTLSTPFIRNKHSGHNDELRQRLEQNLVFVETDGDVASLFGQQQGRTLAVAGAGPTLARHYEYLRQQRGNLCLIAVDAALKPLVEAGIYPDVVVTIDGNEKGVGPFFTNVVLELFGATPLVYFPIVPASIMEIWPGPRLTAYPDQPLYAELAMRHPKGRLFSSGSVIHPAIDLAVRMGACRVLLLGADFSFPGQLSHVEGCEALAGVDGVSSGDWVLNGHGQRVKTAPNLRGYLRDLETYVAENPQIAFVNGSRDGAQIEGTSYLEEGR